MLEKIRPLPISTLELRETRIIASLNLVVFNFTDDNVVRDNVDDTAKIILPTNI